MFLLPFTLGLYYIPESPPWLVWNQEEDLAVRSMSIIRSDTQLPSAVLTVLCFILEERSTMQARKLRKLK